MACSVSAGGVTLDCLCDGCGIVYNHETGKHTALCCGAIFDLDRKVDPGDPPDHGIRDDFVVDFKGLTALQAAQVLDQSSPGRIHLESSLRKLKKKVTINSESSFEKVAKKLGFGTIKQA